jgi:hypothetical protein
MARKQQKSLVKTAAALAATALVEKAIQKAAADPRVRRKARIAGKALKKRVKAARRKITKVIGKRVPKLVRARPKGRKRARA